MVQKYHMSGVFSPDARALIQHITQDMLVTDLRCHQVHAQIVQRQFQPDVAHDRTHHHVVGKSTLFFQLVGADREYLPAGEYRAGFIHSCDAVSVSIKGKPHIRLFPDHHLG